MLIASLQVWCSSRVFDEVQLLNLWDRDSQHVVYSLEPRLATPRRRLSDANQEVSAKWVSSPVLPGLGIADDLRDEMEIANPSEELDDFSEVTIGVHLLQRGLSQALLVSLVIFSRSVQNNLAVSFDNLGCDNRAMETSRLGG